MENINWDKYAAELSWNEMYKNSPFFRGKRIPTFFSKDEKDVYISSLDLAFSSNDLERMENALDDIKGIFRNAEQSRDYYKMAMAKSDFLTIQEILSQLLGYDEHDFTQIEDED